MKFPRPTRISMGGLRPGETPYMDVRFNLDDDCEMMLREIFGNTHVEDAKRYVALCESMPTEDREKFTPSFVVEKNPTGSICFSRSTLVKTTKKDGT